MLISVAALLNTKQLEAGCAKVIVSFRIAAIKGAEGLEVRRFDGAESCQFIN